jgi:hypothetical protein
MAVDQRYCLECGQRRGDPRLPFMDAVVFMDAVKRPRDAAQSASPPPSPERRSRMTANASLIAGVATLVLAIGVGVMIGREGGSASSVAAAPAPQIIKVGGGGEEATTASSAAGKDTGSTGGKGKKVKAPEKAVDTSGTSEAAAEILKPAGDVKLPPPTVQPGGECESGASGCKGGEFTGEFFGE